MKARTTQALKQSDVRPRTWAIVDRPHIELSQGYTTLNDWRQCSLLVHAHDAMYDRNVPILDLENNHLASPYRLVAIGEEQNISALERRLH